MNRLNSKIYAFMQTPKNKDFLPLFLKGVKIISNCKENNCKVIQKVM